MATTYAAPPVSATQVGSYFVQQYYQVLQVQPELTHQFYNDSSSIVRVDGESTQSATALLQIHTLIMSLNFTSIEIETINSLESWSGGVLVVVSGSVESKDFSGSKKFFQTFFLAPQEKGFFVLNDIIHFVNGEVINQPPAFVNEEVIRQPAASSVSEVIHQTSAPVVAENEFDSPPTSSIPLQEPPVSDYALEAEAREYVNSVHIEGDDSVEDYSYLEREHEQEQEQDQEQEHEQEQEQEQEQEHEQEQDCVNDTVEEGTPLEAFVQHEEDETQESLSAVEEPAGEFPTYASILRAPKGNTIPTVSNQPYFNKKASQPPLLKSNAAVTVTVAPEVSDDIQEEAFSPKEGESKSIYVKNLPSNVSTLEVMEEFKNFGRVKKDGVFINNRKDIGVCYAFVEYEDLQSAQNAVKASPIKFAGRQVYVELRKPSTGNMIRGGRRGRGRGGRFGGRTFGRGSNIEGNDSNRGRSNGFRSS